MILISVVSLLMAKSLKSQASLNSDTIIKITEADPRIEILADRYNKTHEIHGFRIQIISSAKKEMAKKTKSKFASMYQDIEAHEIYQQPFFIIKVGDFLTKLEAEKFHREIELEFPGSFIQPDIIEPYKQYTGEKEF